MKKIIIILTTFLSVTLNAQEVTLLPNGELKMEVPQEKEEVKEKFKVPKKFLLGEGVSLEEAKMLTDSATSSCILNTKIKVDYALKDWYVVENREKISEVLYWNFDGEKPRVEKKEVAKSGSNSGKPLTIIYFSVLLLVVLVGSFALAVPNKVRDLHWGLEVYCEYYKYILIFVIISFITILFVSVKAQLIITLSSFLLGMIFYGIKKGSLPIIVSWFLIVGVLSIAVFSDSSNVEVSGVVVMLSVISLFTFVVSSLAVLIDILLGEV